MLDLKSHSTCYVQVTLVMYSFRTCGLNHVGVMVKSPDLQTPTDTSA